MKRFYNATLFTLLSFLLSFNLYGQIKGGLITTFDPCSNADVDLIIEDVVWNADVSDLTTFYSANTPFGTPLTVSPTSLNGVPIPESFHMVILTYTLNVLDKFEWTIYTFDISVAPTSKPVIFVYQSYPFYGLSLITDENGYVEGVNIKHYSGGAGVASTAAVMGRQGDFSGNLDTCIDITATNRTGRISDNPEDIPEGSTSRAEDFGTICDLEDASYSFCISLFNTDGG